MTIANYLTFWLVSSTCFIGALVAHEALVGGYVVRGNDQAPYVVSVQYPKDNHVCGGGFIRDKFVLTAARCLIDHNDVFIPGEIFVRAGSINLRSDNNDTVYAAVRKVNVPKEYNPTSYVANIAVLELSHGLRDNSSTYWLNLSEDSQQRLNDRVIITAGFGWNEVRPSRRGGVIGNSDGLLRYSRGYVLAHYKCEQVYSRGAINAAVHVCAHFLWGAPCTGDTGNLLVRTPRDSRRSWTVVGVLIKRSPTCSVTYNPILHIRISRYRLFIDDVLAGRNSSRIRLHNVPSP